MSIYDVIPVSVNDYQKKAKQRLPKFLFDYIEGGANAEETLNRNTSDFKKFTLKQFVMRDVSKINTATTMLGHKVSMPLALAPIGMAGLFARRGEIQAARAANKVDIPFTLSTVGVCSIEEVKKSTNKPFWFQLYMLRDRGLVLEMLHRAQAVGCTTLVFTVDLALPGIRLRDFRNGMLDGGFKGEISKAAQIITRPYWLYDVGIKGKPHCLGNLKHKVTGPNNLHHYKTFIDTQFDPSATWDDIAWLRSHWQGNILIKGVVEADDAKRAVNVGADGIIISNHGGRQLDGTSSTIMKLSDIVNTVGHQTEVFLDGGIRNGVDVVKALALGAKGVLIGRPWVYAMAAQGENGVNTLLSQFQNEITATMGLMGINNIDEITADLVEC
ncbi:MAG: L-lactate dehydrogenase [Litorilituus sp.]|jgi:L-lactate dehydrogenase (cytochrome)|nr:L-lactate dehydrogenase [Litorilituus sp.]